MIIRKDRLIAGHAAPVIRGLLGKMGSLHVRQSFVERVVGWSPQEAVDLMCELQRRGYISADSDGNERCLYSTTTKGNRLAGASLRPISKSTADRMLRGFVQRIRKVNSNPDFLYTITAVVVFGSAGSKVEWRGWGTSTWRFGLRCV
jgi:hypothetical protein